MTIRFGSALAAIALALGLSACGGSSEFTSKYVEACKAQGGDKQMGDCSCQAGILDKELNDKEKKAFLLIITAMSPGGDPSKLEQQMKDQGITEADMGEMQKKMDGLEDKVKKECKK